MGHTMLRYNHTMGSDPNCPFINAYGTCILEDSCVHFTKIDEKYQCDFVKDTADCIQEDVFIQYMELIACDPSTNHIMRYLGVMMVITEVLILFMVLGVCADNFFSPTLCAVSNALGMSENLAGVTLLAFGNASPDIFTSLAGATFLGPELVECQLLGGGIFVTSIVASAILLTKNFYAIPSAFLRDTIFYMAALWWLRYISSKYYLRTIETSMLIVGYVLYVVVVVLDAMIQRRRNRNISDKVSGLVQQEDRSSVVSLTRQEKSQFILRKYSRNSSIDRQASGKSVRSDTSQHRLRSSSLPNGLVPQQVNSNYLLPPHQPARRRAASRTDTLMISVIAAERLSVLHTAGLNDKVAAERKGNVDVTGVMVDGEIIYEKETNIWYDFLANMNPIDEDEWEESNGCERFIILLKAPITYIMKYIIPVVDQGVMNNGWCKLLNCIHCIVAPLFLCVSLQLFSISWYVSIIIAVSVGGGCVTAAIIVFMTSKVDVVPPYHMVFAVMGFITSMNMIYTVAHELVALMNVCGFLLNVSIATLAMTFLAYGNSVGDIVANTALAKAGYPRMAWAGCFGSPLLSNLLGAGLSLTFLVEKEGENHVFYFKAKYSGLITNCFLFLIMSLGSSLLIIPAMSFQCRRSYASFLIFIYVTFLSFSIMCEYGLVHPLGL